MDELEIDRETLEQLDKIAMVACAGGNPVDTWRAYGIPYDTLQLWVARQSKNTIDQFAEDVVEGFSPEEENMFTVATAMMFGLAVGCELGRRQVKSAR